MANGNGVIIKTIIGGSSAIFLSVLGVMGNGIIENDRRNTEQHIEIRKEILVGDKEMREKLDSIKDIVTDIRIDQRRSNDL